MMDILQNMLRRGTPPQPQQSYGPEDPFEILAALISGGARPSDFQGLGRLDREGYDGPGEGQGLGIGHLLRQAREDGEGGNPFGPRGGGGGLGGGPLEVPEAARWAFAPRQDRTPRQMNVPAAPPGPVAAAQRQSPRQMMRG